MGLQELWFFIIAALFLGFLILEGFDFGVGMLMVPFGMSGSADGGDPEQRRRAALNTIGPVWDANEVWLITAGAAMFAAFPNWYATMFSALYLPLLAILFGMILRIVGIEWRGKVDDSRWRAWADAGIAAGSWLPAILWGVAFAVLVQGLPIDADGHAHLSISDVLNGYTLLGGLATASLFVFYGAVFVALKTAGPVRDDAFRFARVLSLPVILLAGGFALWTQLAHGKSWTWLALAVAVVALLTAVALMWTRRNEGWAFVSMMVVVAAVVMPVVRRDVSKPVALHAEPGLERDDLQRLLDAVHAEDHVVGVVDGVAPGDGVSGVVVLGVPAQDHRRRRYPPRSDCDGIRRERAHPRPRRPSPVARIGGDAPLPRWDDGLRSADLLLRDRLRGCAGRDRRRGDHRSRRTQHGPYRYATVDSVAAVDHSDA